MNLIIIPVQTPNFCSGRRPASWPSRPWWVQGSVHPRAARSPQLLGPAKICPGVPVFGTCTAPTPGAGPKTKFWPSFCPTTQLPPVGPAYRPPTGMRMAPAAQPHRICPRCWCFWHLHCVLHPPSCLCGRLLAAPCCCMAAVWGANYIAPASRGNFHCFRMVGHVGLHQLLPPRPPTPLAQAAVAMVVIGWLCPLHCHVARM